MALLDAFLKYWKLPVPTDCETRDEVAEVFVKDIIRLHGLLSQRGENLEPCKVVNDLFDELVSLSLQILPDQTTRNVGWPGHISEGEQLLLIIAFGP